MITGTKFLVLCYLIFVAIGGVACVTITVFGWMNKQVDNHNKQTAQNK